MVSESLIYSCRLASGLRIQKRERETLTLEKRLAKRGGLTFSSACSASPPPQSRAASTFVGDRGKSDVRVSTRGITAVSFLRDARAIIRSGRDVMHGVQYSRRPVMSCADAHMLGAGKIGNIFTISNSRQRRARDVRRDQVRSGRCCRSGKCRRSGRWSQSGDREDIADRKDIAGRKDYQGVTDRADVPDREIGKILPIEKILPIGNILPIGKMIVLFIFRSNFQ
jgi:hypothetical protein